MCFEGHRKFRGSWGDIRQEEQLNKFISRSKFGILRHFELSVVDLFIFSDFRLIKVIVYVLNIDCLEKDSFSI